MKYVEQAENAYNAEQREAYAGLLVEIDKECESCTFSELLLQLRGTCDSDKIKEVGEELSKACYGGEGPGGGFGSAAFLAQYQGAHAYSYDPEESYRLLQEGKAHLEKAESLLIGKVPGFNAIAAIAGLLFAVYLINRRRKQ